MRIDGIEPLFPESEENQDGNKNQKEMPSLGAYRKKFYSKELSMINHGISKTAYKGRLGEVRYRIDLVRDKVSNLFSGPDSMRGAAKADKSQLIRSLGDRQSTETTGGESRSRKIREVKQRILEGYYDSPNHLEELADILIREFHIED